MPRFRQPPRTIPGATITGDRITLPLEDPNDPRIRAYNDSLALYNWNPFLYNQGKEYLEGQSGFMESRLAYDNVETYDQLINTKMRGTKRDYIKFTSLYPEIRKEGNITVRRYAGTMEFPWHPTIAPTTGANEHLSWIVHRYKKPTYPTVTRELQPLNANRIAFRPATGVTMQPYPYEHTSKNWGKHWQSTSGQSAPKGGGFYFLNRRSDGSNDLLTPEEHENVLRTTQQRPTIRFRNGGVVPTPREAYENNNVYAYRKSTDTFYSPLSGVDVVAKDTRVADAVRAGRSEFLKGSLELTGQPQQQMMGVLTGTRQQPSEAWGFKNPRNLVQKSANFLMDAAIDPANILPGVGIYSLATRTPKTVLAKSLSPYRMPFRKAPHYNIVMDEIKKQLTPENFRRAAEWDNVHGTQLVKSLNELSDKVKQAKPGEYPIRMTFKNDREMGTTKAESVLSIPGGFDGIVWEMGKDLRFRRQNPNVEIAGPSLDEMRITIKESLKDKKQSKLFRDVFRHELRHNIEYNNFFEDIDEAAIFKNIVKDEAIADKMVEQFIKNNPQATADEVAELRRPEDYFREQGEISAYGIANTRDLLLRKGLIKNIESEVKPKHLEKMLKDTKGFINEDFFDFVDRNKTKEWADLLNKYLIGSAPVAVGTGIFRNRQPESKTKQ